MLFRQLFDQASSTYTYLLAADYGQEALIIDPVLEQMPLYQSLLDELKLKLVLSLDTHCHADHVTASGALNLKYQCQIAMGELTHAQHVTKRIRDNETISIDGIELKAIYTPGHTDDSYCFIGEDRVFTGDTLLIRGTGRTDFQSGDPNQQYESLFNKLLALSDQTLVYPAHDYKGMMVSTIGEEKRCNPRLQVTSAAEYVDIMNDLHLPKPKLFDIAVPANLQCGIESNPLTKE